MDNWFSKMLYNRRLIKAAKIGDTEGANKALQMGADPNVEPFLTGTPVLVIAARSKNGAGVVKELLKHGARLTSYDTDDNNALWWAGSEEIARILLEAGIRVDEPNKHGISVLSELISWGVFDDFVYLLRSLDPNERDQIIKNEVKRSSEYGRRLPHKPMGDWLKSATAKRRGE